MDKGRLVLFSKVKNGLRNQQKSVGIGQNSGLVTQWIWSGSEWPGIRQGRAEASQWLKNSRCAKWLQAEEAPFPLLSGASPSLISLVEQPAARPVVTIENNKNIQKRTKVQIKRHIYKEKNMYTEEWKHIRKRADIQRRVHLMSNTYFGEKLIQAFLFSQFQYQFLQSTFACSEFLTYANQCAPSLLA